MAGYYGFTLDVRVSVRPSVVHPSVFRFRMMSKHQWMFTKLGICIDIVEIWFGIANGQILSNIYGVICLRHNSGGVLKFNVFILNCYLPLARCQFYCGKAVLGGF